MAVIADSEHAAALLYTWRPPAREGSWAVLAGLAGGLVAAWTGPWLPLTLALAVEAIAMWAIALGEQADAARAAIPLAAAFALPCAYAAAGTTAPRRATRALALRFGAVEIGLGLAAVFGSAFYRSRFAEPEFDHELRALTTLAALLAAVGAWRAWRDAGDGERAEADVPASVQALPAPVVPRDVLVVFLATAMWSSFGALPRLPARGIYSQMQLAGVVGALVLVAALARRPRVAVWAWAGVLGVAPVLTLVLDATSGGRSWLAGASAAVVLLAVGDALCRTLGFAILTKAVPTRWCAMALASWLSWCELTRVAVAFAVSPGSPSRSSVLPVACAIGLAGAALLAWAAQKSDEGGASASS